MNNLMTRVVQVLGDAPEVRGEMELFLPSQSKSSWRGLQNKLA